MKRKNLAVLILVAVMLTGCSKYHMMSKEDMLGYLNERYQNSFTIISEETRDPYQNDYLDPEMETIGTPEETSDEKPTCIFTISDAEGITFHVTVMWKRGALSANYIYTDDYDWQWLKAKPAFQEWLENSPFPLDYVNEIGRDYDVGAVCYLHISDGTEIEDAVAYAYQVIAASDLLLPDRGCDREDIDVYRIRPRIEILLDRPDGTSWQLKWLWFRSEGSPLLESQETVCAEMRQKYSERVSFDRTK